MFLVVVTHGIFFFHGKNSPPIIVYRIPTIVIYYPLHSIKEFVLLDSNSCPVDLLGFKYVIPVIGFIAELEESICDRL